MRILLAEDEKKIASFIVRGLKEEDYIVDVASDGEEASFRAEVNPYDLIILDIMLPHKDGITICRELRKKKINTPILMLTAKDQVRDKVLGLNSGADDYLAKPFDFEELSARIGALLRRNRNDKTGILQADDLELDPLRHKVRRAGKEIPLSSKEFALLEYLMLNADHVVTRTMISEHVWHEDFDSFTNVIDVYINFLRNKIDKDFKKPLIHTIHGKGYILRKE
ncbi:MAG TPA: response regulator transcription factor [Candidatus Omnitrophota bacterium]|mgnify:CR=1 FL=1|nr:response regulator transcription factor [Candidatus Omnitrophota bacterium]